jgi:hypothetical protein
LSTPCFLSRARCFSIFSSVFFIKRLSPTHSSQLWTNIKPTMIILFNLLHVVHAKHLWKNKPQWRKFSLKSYRSIITTKAV